MAEESTPAVEAVAASGVAYRVVRFERARDIVEAAARRGVAVKRLLKTMVVRLVDRSYVLVLVPGDRVIDWKALRGDLGMRRLALADAEEALDVTGYERGTITPFGAGPWPVIADAAIVGAGEVSVGGGAHGIAIHLDADALIEVVRARVAEVTKPADR